MKLSHDIVVSDMYRCRGGFLACGSHTTQDVLQARIVGGSGATDSQWPTIGLLYNKKMHVQCTSSIVGPKWAMASYACILGNGNSVEDAAQWSLYAGGTHFLGKEDNDGVQVREVKTIVPHPQVTSCLKMLYESVQEVVLQQSFASGQILPIHVRQRSCTVRAELDFEFGPQRQRHLPSEQRHRTETIVRDCRLGNQSTWR